MNVDAAVLLSALVMMGVIVAKMATTHWIAAAKSELVKLGQTREELVERLRAVVQRRVAAENTQGFAERRKDEQLLRRQGLEETLAEFIQREVEDLAQLDQEQPPGGGERPGGKREGDLGEIKEKPGVKRRTDSGEIWTA